MPPVDSLQQQHPQQLVPMNAVASQGAGTISLATLIDFILQRTYHELQILSELLPRKTDMERKIEIVQFAGRTKNVFSRLLALVKWANSAGKVDKCTHITNFLDKQAMLFINTADTLSRISQDTLMYGRLPNFSLPAAIDVLTTGSYPRLPTCIREKIIPPDPITEKEKEETLTRLSQIIQHRLVTNDLPPQLRQLTINNGRVKFHVDHEFEVTLTLMGDGPNIAWRLLDIDILVEDHETGDGKALVHSMQVHYIHQLVQARLQETEKSLHDLYNCLHSFCQSLQLEVLHSQAQRLLVKRLGEFVRIESYNPGKCLEISYWRDFVKREAKNGEAIPKAFKVNVHVDDNDSGKPLEVTHLPPLSEDESLRVGQAIRSDNLSIEKLLVQTVGVRSQIRLKEIQKEIASIVDVECDVGELPPVMYIRILDPCTPTEMLRIAVDMERGTYIASMSQYPECPITSEIEDCINNDRRDLKILLRNLRLWLSLRRCEKSVQHLSVICHEKLPFVNLTDHPLENLSRFKIFIKLTKQSNKYLVVEAVDLDDKSAEYKYFFMEVTPTTFTPCDKENVENITPLYLSAGLMMELNTFVLTHGSHTRVYEDVESPVTSLNSRKRKLFLTAPADMKRAKLSPYFVPELTHILAMCEEQATFISLAYEFEKKGLPHQGIQVDGQGACMSLSLIEMPAPSGVSNSVTQALRKNLLSCRFRLHRKVVRVWLVEMVFNTSPIQSINQKENGPVHRVYLQYDVVGPDKMEKMVQDFQDDWNSIGRLYGAVENFAGVYNDTNNGLGSLIDIRSFTFKRLVLGYGPTKTHNVSIQWSPAQKAFNLSFGTHGITQTGCNPHALIALQLQSDFNHHQSVAQLSQCLNETIIPLTAISRLNIAPTISTAQPGNQRSSAPQPTFTILPQSSTHVRIAYRNSYCIDIHFHGGKLVSIRDGAFSLFDTSKVVDSFFPTPGLKSFLNLFVDEATTAALSNRRRSTAEDDNPPSPTGMDTMEAFMQQPQLIGSPASNKPKQDIRFHGPMTPPSNPLTPASPASARLQTGHPGSSPAAAPFPLASPPSIPGIGQSPAMIGMPNVQSPGNLFVGSPGNANLPVASPSSYMPAPSPMGLMQSPANPYVGQQTGIGESGSPYPNPSSQGISLPSPGNWPNSPSVPRPSPVSRHSNVLSPGNPMLQSPQTSTGRQAPPHPSRIIPQRSWAGSVPIQLSHEALIKLFSPTMTPPSAAFVPCCPLEKFLGCVFMKKHLQKLVQQEEGLTAVPCEPGVILFKSETLQFRVTMNPNTLQLLHMKVLPNNDCKDIWSPDEHQVLEKYFESKVAGPPYKVNALTAFARLLTAPTRILKDFIQLLRLELAPDRNFKWNLQWCLTISPAFPFMAPAGTAAVLIRHNRTDQSIKILIVLQLTKREGPVTPTGDTQSIVVPLLYDTKTNQVTVPEPKPNTPPPSNMAVNHQLKMFNMNVKHTECSLYPAVKELLTNLNL